MHHTPNIQVEQKLETTLQAKHGVCISATSFYMIFPRQIRAATGQKQRPWRNQSPTHLLTHFILYLLKLGYSNYVVQVSAMQISEDSHPLCILVGIYKPSVVYCIIRISTRMTIREPYRGLSGMTREPAARMEPIIHWTKRGIRQE